MMRKLCFSLTAAAMFGLAGCAAFSDHVYQAKIYDQDGKEMTGLSLSGQGRGLYTIRNAVCAAHKGATIIFTDVQTGAAKKPYKCGGGKAAAAAEPAAAVSAGADLWEDEVWQKPGADKPAVRKALMACGAPNPRPEIADMTDNQYMLMARCMEKSGFKNINGDKSLFQCRNYPNLAACAPGAVIPSPSAKRRLSSPWCAAHKDAPECRP